jgi:ribonuclease VapC
LSTLVLDASVILASILGEPGGDEVFDHIEESVVSAVNVAEVYTYAAVHHFPTEAIDAFFSETGIAVLAHDYEQAVATGKLASVTRKAGLSLGDRACLALAQQKQAEVLTADRPWAAFSDGLGLKIRLLR